MRPTVVRAPATSASAVSAPIASTSSRCCSPAASLQGVEAFATGPCVPPSEVWRCVDPGWFVGSAGATAGLTATWPWGQPSEDGDYTALPLGGVTGNRLNGNGPVVFKWE